MCPSYPSAYTWSHSLLIVQCNGKHQPSISMKYLNSQSSNHHGVLSSAISFFHYFFIFQVKIYLPLCLARSIGFFGLWMSHSQFTSIISSNFFSFFNRYYYINLRHVSIIKIRNCIILKISTVFIVYDVFHIFKKKSKNIIKKSIG